MDEIFLNNVFFDEVLNLKIITNNKSAIGIMYTINGNKKLFLKFKDLVKYIIEIENNNPNNKLPVSPKKIDLYFKL